MPNKVKLLVVVLILGLVGWWSWRNKTNVRFTAIDTKGGVTISSFDPVSKSSFEMRLPDNLEIPGAEDRGRWQAGKIGRAGESAWAAESVADYLGITYSRNSGGIWWWEKMGLKWTKLDMSKQGWVEQTKAVDGEVITRLTETWNQAAKEMFSSEAISGQGWQVGVVNATGEIGLGAKTADRVESMGVRVSEVKTGSGEEKGCWVEGVSKNKRETVVKIILKNWSCKWRENTQLGERELLLFLGLTLGNGK